MAGVLVRVLHVGGQFAACSRVLWMASCGRGRAPPTITRFTPFSAAKGLLGIQRTADPEALAVALTRVDDALLFGAYTVATLTLGTVLLYRLDTN